MWRNKKPDAPEPVGLDPNSAQTNQPPKSAPRFLERLTGTNREATRSTRVPAWLGPSLHVKGEISGTEDLLIDGSVEGSVQLNEGKLTIGPTAKLTADIIACAVIVHGNVNGTVRAKNRIEIKKDGSVTGDLTTPQIMIEDGAHFRGSIEIDGKADKRADKDASSRTASAAKAAGAGPEST